jgi:hypothetical protein
MRLVLDGEPPTQSDLPARDYLGSARSSSQRGCSEAQRMPPNDALTSRDELLAGDAFVVFRRRPSAGVGGYETALRAARAAGGCHAMQWRL